MEEIVDEEYKKKLDNLRKYIPIAEYFKQSLEKRGKAKKNNQQFERLNSILKILKGERGSTLKMLQGINEILVKMKNQFDKRNKSRNKSISVPFSTTSEKEKVSDVINIDDSDDDDDDDVQFVSYSKPSDCSEKRKEEKLEPAVSEINPEEQKDKDKEIDGNSESNDLSKVISGKYSEIKLEYKLGKSDVSNEEASVSNSSVETDHNFFENEADIKVHLDINEIFAIIDKKDESDENNVNYSSDEFYDTTSIYPSSQIKDDIKNHKKKKKRHKLLKHKSKLEKKEQKLSKTNSKQINIVEKNLEKKDKVTNVDVIDSLSISNTPLESSEFSINHKNRDTATVTEWSQIALDYEVKSFNSKNTEGVLNSRPSVLYDDLEIEPSNEDYEFLGIEKPSHSCNGKLSNIESNSKEISQRNDKISNDNSMNINSISREKNVVDCYDHLDKNSKDVEKTDDAAEFINEKYDPISEDDDDSILNKHIEKNSEDFANQKCSQISEDGEDLILKEKSKNIEKQKSYKKLNDKDLVLEKNSEKMSQKINEKENYDKISDDIENSKKDTQHVKEKVNENSKQANVDDVYLKNKSLSSSLIKENLKESDNKSELKKNSDCRKINLVNSKLYYKSNKEKENSEEDTETENDIAELEHKREALKKKLEKLNENNGNIKSSINDLFHRRPEKTKEPKEVDDVTLSEFLQKLDEAIEDETQVDVTNELFNCSKSERAQNKIGVSLKLDSEIHKTTSEKISNKTLNSCINQNLIKSVKPIQVIVIDDDGDDDEIQNEDRKKKESVVSENEKGIEKNTVVSKETTLELPVKILPSREDTPPRIVSPDHLRNLVMEGKYYDDDQNEKDVTTKNSAVSKETSLELPVKILPSREDTPPRIVSPDHLRNLVMEGKYYDDDQNEKDVTTKNSAVSKETSLELPVKILPSREDTPPRIVSPDHLRNLVMEGKYYDDDQNEKDVTTKNSAVSKETSFELPVNILPSREDTPPRIVSPDHLRDLVMVKKNGIVVEQNESNVNASYLKEKEPSQIGGEQQDQLNIYETPEKKSTEVTFCATVSSEEADHSFVNFFTEEPENMELPQLTSVYHKLLKELRISPTDLKNVLETNKTTDDEIDNTKETNEQNEQNEQNELFFNKCCTAVSQIIERESSKNSGVPVVNSVTPPLPRTDTEAHTSSTNSMYASTAPNNLYSSVSLPNNFNVPLQNIYQQPTRNVRRYPMINPHDPRLQSRLIYLFKKTSAARTFQPPVPQKQQLSCVPPPPSGLPLLIEELPLSSQTVLKTTSSKSYCPSDSSKSKFTNTYKEYKQAKEAALARKAAKEAEQKRLDQNTFVEAESEIPNELLKNTVKESLMDTMYRNGNYSLETTNSTDFKIPKKKNSEIQSALQNEINDELVETNNEIVTTKSKPVKNRRCSLTSQKEQDEEYVDDNCKVSNNSEAKSITKRRKSLISTSEKLNNIVPGELDNCASSTLKAKSITSCRRSSTVPKETKTQSTVVDFTSAGNHTVQNKIKVKPIIKRRQTLATSVGNNVISYDIDKNSVLKSKSVKTRRKSLAETPKENREKINADSSTKEKTLSCIGKSKPIRNHRRSSMSWKIIEKDDENSSTNDEIEDINNAFRESIKDKKIKKLRLVRDNDDENDNNEKQNEIEIELFMEKLKENLPSESYKQVENLYKCEKTALLESSSQSVVEKHPESTDIHHNVNQSSKIVKSSKKRKLSENKDNKSRKSRKVDEVDVLTKDIQNSFMAEGFLITGRRKCSELAELRTKNILTTNFITNEISSSDDESERSKKTIKTKNRRKSRNYEEKKKFCDDEIDDGEETDDFAEHVARKRKMNLEKSLPMTSQPSNTIVFDKIPIVKLKKLKLDKLSFQHILNSENEPLLEVLKEVPDIPQTQNRSRQHINKKKNHRIEKNRNPEHHIHSKYMNLCLICCKKQDSTHIVSHYVNEHSEYEVFISRLQRRYIDEIKTKQHIATPIEIDSSLKYLMECVFCNQKVIDSFVKFNQHFSTHTGEYQYKCSDCDKRCWRKQDMQKHCKNECDDGARVEKYYSFDKYATIIYAYICEKCNYIQLHQANIEKHLKTEHGVDKVHKSDILQIKLIEIESNGENVEQEHENETEIVFEISTSGTPSQKENELANSSSQQINDSFVFQDTIKIENESISGENVTPSRADVPKFGNNIMTVIHCIGQSDAKNQNFYTGQLMNTDVNQLSNDGNEEVLNIKSQLTEDDFFKSTNMKENDINSSVLNVAEKIKHKFHVNRPSNENLPLSTVSSTEEKTLSKQSSTMTQCQMQGVAGTIRDRHVVTTNKQSLFEAEPCETTDKEPIEDIICVDSDDEDDSLHNHLRKSPDITISKKEFIISQNDVAEKQINKNKRILSNINTIVKISNISFEKTSTGINYYCEINQCSFKSTGSVEKLKEHFNSLHTQVVWNGACESCARDFTSGEKLPVNHEINHMVEQHSDIACQFPLPKHIRLTDNDYLDPVTVKELLRPWIKKCKSKKTMLQCDVMKTKSALFSLYKCMGNNCSFTSNSREEMQIHVESQHQKEIEIRKEETYLECSYCKLKFASSSVLVQHIEKVHGTSVFQCPKCFYRSVHAFNVTTHYKLFHQNKECKSIEKILSCNGPIKKLNVEARDILQCRLKNVKPLQCQVCSSEFYIKEVFYNHVKQSHNIAIESQLPEKDIFACVYCPYDAKSLEDMREHLANEHPIKLPYSCARITKQKTSNQNPCSLDEDSVEVTSLVFVSEFVNRNLFEKYDSADLNDMDNNSENSIDLSNSLEQTSYMQEFIDTLMNLDDVLKIVEVQYRAKINKEKIRKLKLIIDTAVKKSGLSGKDLYKCAKQHCNETFEMFNEWQKHMTTAHSKSLKGVKYMCPHCLIKSLWFTVEELSKHFDEHRQHTFFCYYCGDTALKLELAQKHIFFKHSKQNTVSRLLLFTEHDQEEKEIENYKYYVVLTADTKITKSQLIRHMIGILKERHHIDDDNYNIDLNKQYQIKNLNNYSNNSNNNNQIVKKTIRELFESKLPIFVPPSRNFLCSYCPHKEQNNDSLENHIKEIHSTFTKYECPHCNVEFKTNITRFNQIRNHWQLHSSVISACIACTSFYSTEKDLLHHVNKKHHNQDVTVIQYTRSETSIKKLLQVCLTTKDTNSSTVNFYRCLLCSEDFICMSSIVNHMSSVHVQYVYYQCAYCKYRDIEEEIIFNHLTEKHNKDTPRVFALFCKKTNNSFEDYTCLENKSITVLDDCFNSSEKCDKKKSLAMDNDCDSKQINQRKRLKCNETVVQERPINQPQEHQQELVNAEFHNQQTKCILLNVNLIKCPHCTFQSDTEEAMTEHIRYNHTEQNNDGDDIKTSKKNSNTKRISSLIEHRKSIFKCDIINCQFTSDDENDLNQHKVVNHKRWPLKTPCEINLFSNNSQLWQQQEQPKPSIRLVPIHKLLANPESESSGGSCAVESSESLTSNKSLSCNQINSFLSTATKTPSIVQDTINKNSAVISTPVPVAMLSSATNSLRTTGVPSSTIFSKDSSSSALGPHTSTLMTQNEINFDEIVFVCNYCSSFEKSIDQLIHHWECNHKSQGTFQYSIDRLLQCLYCDFVSIFPKMKNHHSLHHDEEIFVSRSVSNLKKCTECSFECDTVDDVFELLRTHVRQMHPNLIFNKSVSSDYINENLLQKLIRMGLKSNSYRCFYCKSIFRYEDSCRRHIQNFHSNEEIKVITFETNREYYGCTFCGMLYINEKQAIQHTRQNHIKPYVCNLCSNSYFNLSDLREHCINIHNIQQLQEFTKTPLTERLEVYGEIIMLFPAGLILKKKNLKFTSYGNMQSFINLIKTVEKEISNKAITVGRR